MRTAVLSIKLALIDFIHQFTNNYPILLLDDVLSELDKDRQNSLLEYIKDKPAHVDYNLNTIALCKANVIEMIKDKDGFPEANIDYHLAEINYRHARKTLIKMKFSGGIIKEKYELQGKELGDAIISFKNSITDKYKYGEWGGYTFDDFIIDFSLEEIFAAFDKSLEIK